MMSSTPVRQALSQVLLGMKSSIPTEPNIISPESSELKYKYLNNIIANRGPSVEYSEDESVSRSQNNSDDSFCNCRKSRCLKLYCQCFAARIICTPICNCINCANTLIDKSSRNDAVKNILERNPAAFESKFKKAQDAVEAALVHKTGCRCRKSHCLKKYCECYQASIDCSPSCSCSYCFNNEYYRTNRGADDEYAHEAAQELASLSNSRQSPDEIADNISISRTYENHHHHRSHANVDKASFTDINGSDNSISISHQLALEGLSNGRMNNNNNNITGNSSSHGKRDFSVFSEQSAFSVLPNTVKMKKNKQHQLKLQQQQQQDNERRRPPTADNNSLYHPSQQHNNNRYPLGSTSTSTSTSGRINNRSDLLSPILHPSSHQGYMTAKDSQPSSYRTASPTTLSCASALCGLLGIKNEKNQSPPIVTEDEEEELPTLPSITKPTSEILRPAALTSFSSTSSHASMSSTMSFSLSLSQTSTNALLSDDQFNTLKTIDTKYYINNSHNNTSNDEDDEDDNNSSIDTVEKNRYLFDKSLISDEVL